MSPRRQTSSQFFVQFERPWGLEVFLGLEISRSSEGIATFQRQYALQLLEDFDFLAAKSTHTLMNLRLTLNNTDGSLLNDLTHYRNLDGKMLYLTITRMDITFYVNTLSQFIAAPRDTYLKAAHHLLRYIKLTIGPGVKTHDAM